MNASSRTPIRFVVKNRIPVYSSSIRRNTEVKVSKDSVSGSCVPTRYYGISLEIVLPARSKENIGFVKEKDAVPLLSFAEYLV